VGLLSLSLFVLWRLARELDRRELRPAIQNEG
jgi:hypothetical protein